MVNMVAPSPPASAPCRPALHRLLAVGLALAALLAWPAPGAVGGQPPQGEPVPSATAPPEPQPLGSFEEQMSVSWVLVPVLVQGPDGFVNDLGREDFRLYVDGERVAFADFESGATAPMSLVFLQDLSGSMANGGKLVESKRALGYLLSKARPRDEFALATFAGEMLRVEVPFTREEQVLAESMDLWEAYGTTALHDAVAWIPRISADGRHPKRAVILVTDGVDNASDVAPEEAREMVRRARLPLYVLGLGRESVAPREGSSYGVLLRDLATATGGHYFPVRPGEEVYAAAANLLDQLRQQYVLAFPVRSGTADERYRELEVEAGEGNRYTVYHRRGYRGGPPSGG